LREDKENKEAKWTTSKQTRRERN